MPASADRRRTATAPLPIPIAGHYSMPDEQAIDRRRHHPGPLRSMDSSVGIGCGAEHTEPAGGGQVMTNTCTCITSPPPRPRLRRGKKIGPSDHAPMRLQDVVHEVGRCRNRRQAGRISGSSMVERPTRWPDVLQRARQWCAPRRISSPSARQVVGISRRMPRRLGWLAYVHLRRSACRCLRNNVLRRRDRRDLPQGGTAHRYAGAANRRRSSSFRRRRRVPSSRRRSRFSSIRYDGLPLPAISHRLTRPARFAALRVEHESEIVHGVPRDVSQSWNTASMGEL